MNTIKKYTASGVEKVEENVLWDSLSVKEKLVLVAMLTTNSDVEAIKTSPVKKSQFYEYKKRLLPIKKKLVAELLNKAIENLQGNTLKATKVLEDQLESRSETIRLKVAESILDRTIGRPNMAETTRPVNKSINFHIIGVPQEKIDRLFHKK